MSVVRQSSRSGQGLAQDPLKLIFERLFDGNQLHNGASDDSSIVTSQWTPRVDIKEEEKRFVLFADIPGVDPEQIEVQMDKGILTIRGERIDEAVIETETFSRIERQHGNFHRRFSLPDSADAEGIEASGHNGVLTISIPKRAESTPRRIQVGSGVKS